MHIIDQVAHGNESVTDYLIRAENIIMALREAGETMSDGRTVSMILGGLPETFKPLAVHVTQNEDNVTLADFKRRLLVYEEAEKMNTTESTDNVMKTHVRQDRGPTKTHAGYRKDEDANVTCYKCGIKGQKARKCYRKVWCNYCKKIHTKNPCVRKRGDKTVPERS